MPVCSYDVIEDLNATWGGFFGPCYTRKRPPA